METLEEIEKALADGVLKPFQRVRLETVVKIKRGGRPRDVAEEMGCTTRGALALVSQFDVRGAKGLFPPEENDAERDAAESGQARVPPELPEDARAALTERMKAEGLEGSLAWFRDWLHGCDRRVGRWVTSHWYSLVRVELFGPKLKRPKVAKEPKERKRRGVKVKHPAGPVILLFGRTDETAAWRGNVWKTALEDLGVPRTTFHRIVAKALEDGTLVTTPDGRIRQPDPVTLPVPLEVVDL